MHIFSNHWAKFQISGPFQLTGIWAQAADNKQTNKQTNKNNNNNDKNKPAQFQKGSTSSWLEP